MTAHRAYLDHAATTPTLPEVAAALQEALAQVGNASSVHGSGRAARRRVEESREAVAAALGARPSEVIFTSGGTEADNMAVAGLLRGRRHAEPRRHRLVIGAIEHSAVRDCAAALAEHDGATVTEAPSDSQGFVTADAVRDAIESGPGGPRSVAMVSVMTVNNEIGTVQPVAQIAAVAREHGIPLHTDAVQAVGHLPVDFAATGADLLSVSGHKVGGPPGVGLLVARRDLPIQPISQGGGQERALRSGTVPTALAVGLAVAVTAAAQRQEAQAERLTALRDQLIRGAMAAAPGVRPTGHWTPGDRLRRSPANAHLLIPDCDGDSLLFLLDAAGVECSTGSACHAGVPQPSHVVLALGHDEQEASGALRLTLGHTSSEDDVRAFLAAFPEAVARAQRARRAALARRAG